jgi:hypothetical protein
MPATPPPTPGRRPGWSVPWVGSPPVGDYFGRRLAPILLTGANLIAGILQSASYSPVRTTIRGSQIIGTR